MSAMTVESYQEQWDATSHDCVLCRNRGYYATLDNADRVTGYVVCDFDGCAAGAMLPPALRRQVEDGTIEGAA